uniref:Globin domain-containing protein n=1 Tax=Clastoptera arizonana TaxID=38151 RepID=A0A1B6EFS4_9HEMI
MGNTATGRRNSILAKQESSSSDGKVAKPSRQNTLIEEETTDDASGAIPEPSPLTEGQKQILNDTWKVLEEDIAKVGVITFISLFETHPDVQQVFLPFSGIELEDLKHSKQLRAHALRVMAFVQKAVARLEEPEKLEALLRELGKKHYSYGAKAKYIDLIGPQFIQAIKPSLEEKWSDEVHDAWASLFFYMGCIMKQSMATEEALKLKAQ